MKSKKELLLELSTQVPDPNLCRFNPICPYCGSFSVKKKGHSQTLVSSNNHHSTLIICLDCDKKSLMHNAYKNVWYTPREDLPKEVVEDLNKFAMSPDNWTTRETNEKVLKGFPSCCDELYILTHKGCGGDLELVHYNKKSEEREKWLYSVTQEGFYGEPTFYECNKCDLKQKVDKPY